MPYIHKVSFEVPNGEKANLVVGRSLERVIGFLRTLLPSHPGFITSRAMSSVDDANSIHIVFQSVWECWDDLVEHQKSQVAEGKILKEFGALMSPATTSIRTYEDIA